MGYDSGRSGNATKTLLNQVENHDLHKGNATLNNDVAASIAANAIIFGVGNGCEVTDAVTDSSLYNTQAIIAINGSGKALLQTATIPSASMVTTTGSEAITINGSTLNVMTRDTSQTISGSKTFSSVSISGNLTGNNYVVALGTGTHIADYVDPSQDSHLARKAYVDTTASTAAANVAKNNIAPEYSYSSAYNFGALAVYQGQLYRCTTAIPSGEAWNSAHWTATKVLGEFVDLRTNQDISGSKSFINPITVKQQSDDLIYADGADGACKFLTMDPEGEGDTYYHLWLNNIQKIRPNQSGYGLVLPSNSGWTADKTIATTDQIVGASLYVHSIKIGMYNSTVVLTLQSLASDTFSTPEKLYNWLRSKGFNSSSTPYYGYFGYDASSALAAILLFTFVNENQERIICIEAEAVWSIIYNVDSPDSSATYTVATYQVS